MNIINEHYKCSFVMIIFYDHFLCAFVSQFKTGTNVSL